MSEIVDQSDATLLNSFQRDLNRATDSDRSTRKRGLQKLLEDVPWSKKSQREKLKVFVSNSLLRVLFSTIADEVEKCRELTMQILKRCLEKCNDISAKHMHELVVILCARIGEVPFAEPAEEIRLLIVEVLLMIKKHTAFINVHTSISVDAMVTSTGAEQSLTEIDEKILQTLTKTLTDGFPSVKRSGAELMLSVGLTSPSTVKSYFKQLLKPLSTNSTHQHSKTRTITLQAIGRGLQCLGLEEYHTLLKDPILAILLRTVSDRTASVRIELGNVCVNIFTHRVEECLARECALLAEDFELIVVLLLLHGDVIEEVAQEGKRQLIRAVRHWKPLLLKVESLEVDVPIHHSGMDIEDGEKALATAHTSTEADLKPPSDCNASAVAIDYDNITQLTAFMSSNLHNLLDILHEGVESWTTDSRKRYLRAMNRFISYTDASLNTVLPRILSLLAPAVRDEDAEVRVAAEECCVRLGAQAVPEQLLEILLPRMAGAVAGGDTASQRANAISVLTCILKGVRQQSVSDSVNTLYLCTTVATGLTESSLYTYREASLRESVLLLVRVFVEHFSEQCQASAHIQEALLLALLFLCGKCPGEDDVISEVAHKELRRMALTCTGSEDPGPLLGAHYAFLFYHVTTAELSSSALLGGKVDISDTRNAEVLTQFYTAVELRWESDSHAMATFAVLLREAPYPSWAHHAWVLPVVRRMVQPVQAPATGSAEANMLSYAAQRGEDVPNVNIGLVDARLHLLALLEGMVRAGTANWECSQHIATASATIIRFIIVPNLVWRVGRVEATVRKVALALAYGILKAGAVPSETLFSTAAELVPLIVSHLDDSEVTPRQMACLCVTVLFERLRGVFSEQSIHEIYPKLVARLDDSNDQVRIAICGALVMFFQCGAHPRCFSSTTIDYTLDQLFIHLDDPDPSIQQAVLAAIVQLAKTLDKEAVLKKADKNRSCHRTPVMCDKVVFEVTGVEILED